jgi:hypothetical protein
MGSACLNPALHSRIGRVNRGTRSSNLSTNFRKRREKKYAKLTLWKCSLRFYRETPSTTFCANAISSQDFGSEVFAFRKVKAFPLLADAFQPSKVHELHLDCGCLHAAVGGLCAGTYNCLSLSASARGHPRHAWGKFHFGNHTRLRLLASFAEAQTLFKNGNLDTTNFGRAAESYPSFLAGQ